MAARAETIFHQRGSTESMGGVLHEMLARLRAGRSVAVFPEGRTRDGREIGPFHARIFLAAVETGAPVQPVALRYGAHGAAQTRVAFQRGEHFLGNLLRLLGEPPRRADVIFLEPILPGASDGRRGIAELARERIVAAMEREHRTAIDRRRRMLGPGRSSYAPPWWLRSPHLQTMLGSSPWRRHRGATLLAATGATTSAHLIDGGDGVRLQGAAQRRARASNRADWRCCCTAGKAAPSRATCA